MCTFFFYAQGPDCHKSSFSPACRPFYSYPPARAYKKREEMFYRKITKEERQDDAFFCNIATKLTIQSIFMKSLTNIAALILCCLLSNMVCAQEETDNKYLKGAVPEENGKVVFDKQYSIPEMTQDEIYDRMLKWMNTRLQENQNNSRVLYSNKEKGQIVGTGDEWIVFSSSALSLDRTRIIYQLTVTCQPEKCDFRIEKIRYIYREGEEKYTAEEWITDKYALNKSQTKLVRGLAKWRRKTVDFAEKYYQQVADALSAAESPEAVQQPKSESQADSTQTPSDAPIVIVPKRKVETQSRTQTETPVSVQQPAPTAASTATSAYKEMAPDALLQGNAIQTNNGRLVIVIGADPFNQTVMTANAGGSLGTIKGKAVVFTILSPDQAHDTLDKASEYTVRFYPNGSDEPTLILQCRKLASPETPEGMPRTYIGEIIKALSK